MSANPFAPPNAPTGDPPVIGSRRPLSVWIMMILATATAALIAYGIVPHLLALASNRWLHVDFVLAVTLRVIVWIGIVGAAIGSFRGTAWGRWLGLVLIAGMLAITVCSAIVPSRADGLIKKFRYTNQAAGEAGELMATGLFCALEAWWFFAFGFSRRARAYFAGASRGGTDHVPRS